MEILFFKKSCLIPNNDGDASSRCIFEVHLPLFWLLMWHSRCPVTQKYKNQQYFLLLLCCHCRVMSNTFCMMWCEVGVYAFIELVLASVCFSV